MATKKKTVKKKQLQLPAPTQIQIPGNIDPQAMIMTAVQSGASIDVLERLLGMRERLQKEEAERQFREAMSDFQAECPVIKKGREIKGKDGKVRYRYASLDDIVRQVKPLISKHGFSYRTETNLIKNPDAVEAIVVVTHVMGHSERSSFTVPVTSSEYISEPQTFGVAQTFAQRYAFRNAFGILTGDEDTDGRMITVEVDDGQAKRKEAEDKMNELPENVKQGFRVLGYTAKTAYMFCQKFEWNHKKIMLELNKIADATGPKKVS